MKNASINGVLFPLVDGINILKTMTPNLLKGYLIHGAMQIFALSVDAGVASWAWSLTPLCMCPI